MISVCRRLEIVLLGEYSDEGDQDPELIVIGVPGLK
jgi:hypothetical protein